MHPTFFIDKAVKITRGLFVDDIHIMALVCNFDISETNHLRVLNSEEILMEAARKSHINQKTFFVRVLTKITIIKSFLHVLRSRPKKSILTKMID